MFICVATSDTFCAHDGCSERAVWRLVNLKDMYRNLSMLSCEKHLAGQRQTLTNAGWNVAFQPYPDGSPVPPSPLRSG